jgi:hypothetical protein
MRHFLLTLTRQSSVFYVLPLVHQIVCLPMRDAVRAHVEKIVTLAMASQPVLQPPSLKTLRASSALDASAGADVSCDITAPLAKWRAHADPNAIPKPCRGSVLIPVSPQNRGPTKWWQTAPSQSTSDITGSRKVGSINRGDRR